jgi:hypothetical protein
MVLGDQYNAGSIICWEEEHKFWKIARNAFSTNRVKKKKKIIIKGIQPRVERQRSVPGPGVVSVPAQERT